jgi:hypothetical protein
MNKELNHHKSWIEKALEDKSLKHEDKLVLLALRVEINNAILIFEQADGYLRYFEKNEEKFGGRWFWRLPEEQEEESLHDWSDNAWTDPDSYDEIPGFDTKEEALEDAIEKGDWTDAIPFMSTRKKLREVFWGKEDGQ